MRSHRLVQATKLGALFAVTITALLWPAPRSAEAASAADLDAGWNHNCIVTTVGAVHCWGRGGSGQLGGGKSADSNTPIAVSGLAGGVVEVSAHTQHACAVTVGGSLYCWGGTILAN